MIRPGRWLPALMLMVGGTVPTLAQELEKPPPGYTSPTIYRAGPAWLNAKANVQTRIDLEWKAVADAKWYRIMRSSPSSPEAVLAEIPWNSGEQDLPGGYFYHWDYLPSRSGGVTFTYKVYAIFVEADGSKTPSAPSPTAAATALVVVAPSKLRVRVGLSPIMGRSRVTLDWSSVAGATGYYVFQIPRVGLTPLPMKDGIVTQTSLTIDNVVAGQGSTVCVCTVYAGTLKDDAIRTCELAVVPKS